MGSPVKAVAAAKNDNLEDLLDNDSLDGGMVNGVEQSFDFNPPEAVVNSRAAATGFDAEFTETVVLENNASAKGNVQATTA